MNRNRAFLVALAVLLIGLVIYLWPKSRHSASTPTEQNESASQPSPATAIQSNPDGRPAPLHPELAKPGVPERNEPDKNQQKAFMAAFLTPISFWGKVVDEKGNPIAGAAVKLGANNNPSPMGEGSKYQRITDSDGLFSITGIHGIDLSVEVSKEGYYQTAESSGAANYVLKNNSDRPVPTSERPAIFVLRKKGETVPLVRVSERPVKVPKNGTPIAISLQTGRAAASQESLTVECWTEDQAKDTQGHYPCHCRVSVSGGGLVKREGEFDFEAPAEGYAPSDEIVPSKDRWVSHAERQYFVKTADNHYARVTVDMRTGGEHFVTIESYLNPQPGSRNLEYDSSKQASSP